MTTSVDVAFCIDATGGMSPWFTLFKNNLPYLNRRFIQLMGSQQKRIDQFRVRVVLFRDLKEDQQEAIVQSSFFELPKRQTELEKFFVPTHARGGGDEPESGLEALGLAMRSRWTQYGDRKRHLIVVFTDASAHPLENAARQHIAECSRNRPRSWAELRKEWWGLPSSKRLLLWTPEVWPWSEISSSWDHVRHVAVRAGQGLIELDYESVLESIVSFA